MFNDSEMICIILKFQCSQMTIHPSKKTVFHTSVTFKLHQLFKKLKIIIKEISSQFNISKYLKYHRLSWKSSVLNLSVYVVNLYQNYFFPWHSGTLDSGSSFYHHHQNNASHWYKLKTYKHNNNNIFYKIQAFLTKSFIIFMVQKLVNVLI